ncbi:MAG TPA: helix-turn-helix transcriptional regulator [Actinoplanes sp.]|jgi:transcriptional regulator with XRE-family HTH domain
MTSPGPLARYLRARRQRLQPQDVGLAAGSGQRRVVGLRREEVAVLAGISTDYYLRLEQGRDAHPSAKVLDALARALQLDRVATAYLHGLAQPLSAPGGTHPGDFVPQSTRWLIDSWPLTAAVIHNRYIEVLASNALARALNPNYRIGVNSVLSLLLDPSERTFHTDWEALAARSVALLRSMADTHRDDHRLRTVVAEGSAGSAMFREFWDRHDVAQVGDGVHVVNHPAAGQLTLHYLRLPLVGTEGQSIFLYTAQPDTSSAAALRHLAGPGWEQQGQGETPAPV